MKLDDNRVEISWGKVLGVQKYRLYRRVKGEQEFRLIYEGKANCFVDKTAAGVCKAFAMPGSLDNRLQDRHVINQDNTSPATYSQTYMEASRKLIDV